MKYEAIRQYSREFSVRKMCHVLDLADGAYYQWRRRKQAREAKKEQEKAIIEKVREVFETSKRVYGYRRMQLAMTEEGLAMSEYKVRRIMRQNGFYPVTTLRFKPARKGKGNGNFFENLIKQNFNPGGLNEIWAGDITYIKTCLGWVYLAIVLDLYNKEVIGYSISKDIDTELVKRALSNALVTTRGRGKGTIFHSDRGIQYSSKSFQAMLRRHGITGSMNRPGCPYDNACAESFFSTAKRECLYRKEYATIDDVKLDLFEYIELFYNRKRMHQSLGYKSPVDYRLAQIAVTDTSKPEYCKRVEENRECMQMAAF
jgi:putative transposase